MSLAALIAYIALRTLFYAMFARLVLDIVRSVKPSWRPRSVLLVVAEVVMTITDPLVKTARRIIPPVRIGSVGIDLGWTLIILLLGIASGIVQQF